MRLPVLVVLGLCVSASAGVLKLKDGSTVEGDLKKSGPGWEVTQADGKKRVVSEDDVVSIQTSVSNPSDPREAAERLASLRRSVDAMSDIGQIIQRYETTIDQISKSPSADEARADLQKWRDRQAQGLRKVGKEWVTPETFAAMQGKNQQNIEQARDLVKQRRLRDAMPVLDAVLQVEPANVSALYLKGVICYRQDQIPQARRLFEQVIAAMPTCGPALNNLAVTQWRQNASTIALSNLQRAMSAMPLNSLIHDNVAEALNGASRDARESAAGKRLLSQFQQDEKDLQATMAQLGWYRWGSTWVNEDQLKQLRQEEESIRTRQDELTKEYDNTTMAIERINDRVSANEHTMANMETASLQVDNNTGRAIRQPFPSSYYDLKRENDQLALRKKREMDRLDKLKAEAEDVKHKRVVPPYSGQLKLLDEQFMPNPAGPTTAPVAAPSGTERTPVTADPLPSGF